MQSAEKAEPFVAADGSTICELVGIETARVQSRSLAEATLSPGPATRRRYHEASEDVAYLLEGSGEIEVDGRGHTRGDRAPS